MFRAEASLALELVHSKQRHQLSIISTLSATVQKALRCLIEARYDEFRIVKTHTGLSTEE